MSLGKAWRMLAVCSALALGIGFVTFRHLGQAEKPVRPVDGSSPPKMPTEVEPAPVITFLPSSKSISMPVFSTRKIAREDKTIIPLLPQEIRDGKTENLPLLPSSKIGGFLRSGDSGVFHEGKEKEGKKDPTEHPPPP